MKMTFKYLIPAMQNGAFVRFTWGTCKSEVIMPDGTSVRIDGRTYYSLACCRNEKLTRREYGRRGENITGLVIEWRLKQ
jgi:hypothetical protein